MDIASFDIPEELKRLPQKPGVYIMHDEFDAVIYVGKAINLKNRVRQYFQPSNQKDEKTRGINYFIRYFEYIVTDTELEALVLECNLIKKYRPKYNVMLKDDKSYPVIRITKEAFPRVFSERSRERDRNSRYFGPYSSGVAVNETMELVNQIWKTRLCSKHIMEGGGDRPCLNFHINKCLAPCAGKISQEAYGKIIDEVISFLNGNHSAIMKDLSEKMRESSEDLEYEKAAEYRNKLFAVKKLSEKQKLDIISRGDQDAIAIVRSERENEALAEVFYIRDGKMIGREHFLLSCGAESDEELLSAFIIQHYSGTPFIPKEILTEREPADFEALTEWLASLKGRRVALCVPKIGEKLRLIELARQNAQITYQQFGEKMKREAEKTHGALREIEAALGLPFRLDRIEAYDISNIQGVDSVASMIVFENGKPARNEYRKFKIKTVISANDYASMDEVLTRRFARYFKERAENAAVAKFSKLPDMLFIDGGKGQVSTVEAVVARAGLSIPVCGMVKDDNHDTRGLFWHGEEFALPKTSEGFKLLVRIQDEVHRFAIEYHRKLRQKTAVHSLLDDIAGIGPKRRKALLRHFGDVEAIAAAGLPELREAGLDKKTAEAVYGFFRTR